MSTIERVLRPSAAGSEEERLASVAEWRAEIINDILNIGLKSRSRTLTENRVSLGSSDEAFGEPSCEIVHGNLIESKYSLSRSEVRKTLYETAMGSLSVIAERDDPEDFLNVTRRYWRTITPEQKTELENRIAASFLVVCPSSVVYDLQLWDLIPSSNFSCLIFPKRIWEEYVNLRNRVLLPCEVKVIENFRGEEVDILPSMSIVPDYEEALMGILANGKSAIWIHGVRLPTEEDFRRLKIALDVSG